MSDALDLAMRLAVVVFVLISMMGMGLNLRLVEILGSLRSTSLVVRLLLVNFVLAPAVACALARVFALSPSLSTGLLLAGMSAGSPFLPKLVELARGDLAFAVALMAILVTGTIVYVPFALPWLAPGMNVGPVALARSLLALIAVPLGLGLFVNARRPAVAARFRRAARQASTCALAAVVMLVVARHYGSLIDLLGTGAIPAVALFICLNLTVGFALGGPGAATRKVLAFGTALRNLAAAFVVATLNLADPQVVVMLAVVMVQEFVLLVGSARLAGRLAG